MGLAKRHCAHLACVLALTSTLVSQTPAFAAEEKPPLTGLSLELNRVEQNGEACRATLMVLNGFEASLEKTAFELVMFDKAGLIRLMTVFDFGALPAGKTLVRRFDLPDIQCAELTRILVNGVARCAGSGIDVPRCEANFTTDNRTEIEFGR